MSEIREKSFKVRFVNELNECAEKFRELIKEVDEKLEEIERRKKDE